MGIETADDHTLVKLANQGNEAAFNTLYDRHKQWVVSLAFRFLGGNEDAWDVMQETFIELFNRFPGFTLSSKSLRAYLYPAVKHRSVSLIRKQRKVVSIDSSDDIWLPVVEARLPDEFQKWIAPFQRALKSC